MKRRIMAILLALMLMCGALDGIAALAEDGATGELPAAVEAEPAPEAEYEVPAVEAVPAVEEAPELPAEEVSGAVLEPEETGDAEPETETTPEPDPTQTPEPETAQVLTPEATETPALTPENAEAVDPRDCQHPVTVAVLDRDAAGVHYEDLHDGSHRVVGKGVLAMVCADCGMVVSRRDEYVEKCAYAESDESGAACRYCGHVRGDDGRHIHEFTGAYHTFTGGLLQATPAQDQPELYHICKYQKTQARKCARCDAYETPQDVTGETVDAQEYHSWNAEGRCRVCGYVRSCAHDGAVFENTWTEDERCTFVNASVHAYSAVRYAQRCCALCGEPLDNASVTRVTEDQPHRFVDGTCADCGYVNVCDHPDLIYTYSYDPDATVYAAVDALYHRAYGDGVRVTGERCPDCGFVRNGLRQHAPGDGTVVLPHRFDRDGVCADCGYKAQADPDTCAHPQEYRIGLDASDIDALKRSCRYAVDAGQSDEHGHVLRVEYDASWVCALCGHREDLSGEARTIVVSEPHHFRKGYCVTAGCGYRCPHSQVDGNRLEGSAFYEYDGAEGHYLALPTVATGTCALCGEYVKNHTVSKERGPLQPHSLRDGVCRICGYACDHPTDQIVKLLPVEQEVCEPCSAAEHTVRLERVTETICMACGYTLFEEVEVLGETLRPHRFEGGVCAECGCAEDGSAAISPDAYAALPAETVLNGVAAADGLDIVDACARVGDALQPGVDAGSVRVEIEHLDRLLDDDELARLARLPLREQLLVAQCFLGFRDAVAEATSGDARLLGNAARTLIDSVQGRLDCMDADDRSALEETLRRDFPMTALEVGPGVTAEVFNIDLRIQANGTAVHDRYSFRDTGSAWTLTAISTR